MSRHEFVVTVTGEMDQRLRAEFEDAEITVDHSVTRLRVVGVDASVLHGILARLHALDLELLDISQVVAGSPRRR